MKRLKQFMTEEYSRACLMVTVKPEDIIRELQKSIPREILNPEEDEANGDIVGGLQMHLHITVLYGLESDLDTDKLLPFISNYRGLPLYIKEIEIFENESHVAVLKIESDLANLHREIRENFKVNLTYNEYKSHLTLAYLKKGEYFRPNIIPFELRIDQFVFSNQEGVHKIL